MATDRQKVELCNILVNSKKKRITDEDVLNAAKTVDISYSAARRAWKNFVETSGSVDRRKSTNIGSFGIPVKKKPCTKYRDISKKEAAKILLEFMQPKVSSTFLSNKYNFSILQLYSWIHDIEVSGKLYGTRILNPEKYNKPNVLTVIAYYKNPNSLSKRIRQLTDLERLNYKRVADVLKDYLTSVALS